MKVTNTLRKVWRACRNMLAMICLCGVSGLLFTACDPYNTEENIDPIYAVDLGLSVKWAWCNVGASIPEDCGLYFAWGELYDKYSFDRSNYALYNSDQNSYVDVGENISGTAYDVAHYRLGDDWRLPTEEEVQELKDKCKWEKSFLNGVDGMFVTGPNGNRIFLPNANNGYWSGTYASENYGYKYSRALTWSYSLPWLNGESANVKVKEMTCYSGLAVRPVKGKLQSSVEKPDTDEEIGGTEEDIPSKTFTVGGVSFKMIEVEGGTFTMGSLDSDDDAWDYEKPAHQVTLSSYYIGETEVTQALWKAVMGSNPSKFTGDLKRPVEQVNWNDCQIFIHKLNELTGENFCLPTEAEWEYAARGGKKSKGYKYSGSNTFSDVAKDSEWNTYAVKTKQPNELGVYDMTGNVWEWCYDWYGDYSSSSQTDPTGPSAGSYRVVRGSSWSDGSDIRYRVAWRDDRFPDDRNNDVGLRLAISSTERDDDPITITTGEAANITSESATLSGVVSGATNGISCGIIYGTASDITSLNNNREGGYYDGAYSIDVSYLQPGTTYYYCAYAIIGDEEQLGEVRTFTTRLPSRGYTVGLVSFNMIGVEGGTFTMGSPDSDSDAYSNEKPAHQVTLSSYYIGETEVTQELWKWVMGDNPSYFTGDLQRPVENVSWYDCQTFISKLNELTGENFRLPTEAEWEYAARGGNKSKGYKYSGSNTVNDVAWYDDNSSNTTHAVKTKQPNELGIYDMSGNVCEWCSDWYGSYSSSAQTDPTGPSSGSLRVLRGGSWYGHARGCRVAYRFSNSPDCRYGSYGFRLSLQFIP